MSSLKNSASTCCMLLCFCSSAPAAATMAVMNMPSTPKVVKKVLRLRVSLGEGEDMADVSSR